MINIHDSIEAHRLAINHVEGMSDDILNVASIIIDRLQNGGKVLWMGNGGSAADSQHMAAELVGRYSRERKGLASIALTTDSSILTSIGNDYGFDAIFSRQIEALCTAQDVVIGISTSGNSPNVLAAMEKAREIGAYAIGFSGRDGGKLSQAVDHCFTIPVEETARIQEGHSLIGHLLCDLIEESASRDADSAG